LFFVLKCSHAVSNTWTLFNPNFSPLKVYFIKLASMRKAYFTRAIPMKSSINMIAPIKSDDTRPKSDNTGPNIKMGPNETGFYLLPFHLGFFGGCYMDGRDGHVISSLPNICAMGGLRNLPKWTPKMQRGRANINSSQNKKWGSFYYQPTNLPTALF